MTGAELIAAERRRQVEGEGYTAEHDAGKADDLAIAGAVYAQPERRRTYGYRPGIPLQWPWMPEAWKPTPDDRVRELTKAGALIAAAIDALRAEGAQ